MPRIDLEAIQAKIDNQNLTLSEPQPSQRIFSDDERRLVSWFFASIRTQWGVAKFNSQFGEGEDVQFAKRHWAPRIVKHTPEALTNMLALADNERLTGNEKFAWPDPAMILALQDNAWERAAHRLDFTGHAQIEDLTTKEKRRQAGLSEIQKLRENTGL